MAPVPGPYTPGTYQRRATLQLHMPFPDAQAMHYSVVCMIRLNSLVLSSHPHFKQTLKMRSAHTSFPGQVPCPHVYHVSGGGEAVSLCPPCALSISALAASASSWHQPSRGGGQHVQFTTHPNTRPKGRRKSSATIASSLRYRDGRDQRVELHHVRDDPHQPAAAHREPDEQV